jgi:tetratricopeptide (TPR) repeat protein
MILILLIAGQVTFRVLAQDLNEAVKLTRSEQFNAADKMFQALVKKEPGNGDIYFYYGNNFLERYFADTLNISFRRMVEQAQVQFQTGIQKDPSNPLNYIGLGEISLLQKDTAGARPYFEKAHTFLPSRKNKTIVMAPERHAVVLIRMADAYVKSYTNDTIRIFAWLRDAEKLDRKNFDLYIVRGDAYIFLLNDGSKAIANYNIAQSYNPNSPLAKLRTGQLWMRAKQYQLALNYYYDVIKIDSTFAPAYRELGFLLSKAGRYDEAKKYFKKFLELSSGNIAARAQFINTLIELQDYKEAIVQIQAILATDTSIIDLYRALAYSYYETEEYDKGLAAMEKFLSRSDPEKIRATDYSYYGRILSKNRLDSVAAINLIKAYEMDTSKIDLLSEAAMCYNRIKDYPSAVGIYSMKSALGKANALDYYNWGKAYYNLQNYPAADSIFNIFTGMQPAYVQGYVWQARTRANLDPDSDVGLAKPVYEKILEVTQNDSVANRKDRLEAYYYLAYYYYHQFVLDKQNKDHAIKSVEYSNYVLAIDPENEKAKSMVDILKKIIK